MISRPLVVIGTRPEAIKLAPVVLELRKNTASTTHVLCTGQHGDVVRNVLEFFGIENAIYLSEFKEPDLGSRYAEMLMRLDTYIKDYQPDSIIVQGDTLSTFCGAMAGYLNQIPVAHIEAGLRSYDTYSPFPEEMNRRLVGQLSKWHFAPADSAVKALLKEGITEQVYMVGNTAVDAIELAVSRLHTERWDLNLDAKHTKISKAAPYVLVTIHRRENWENNAIDNALIALKAFHEAKGYISVLCLHPNPDLSERIQKKISGCSHVILCDALPYPDFIWAMQRSKLILTDSGGIQEEAPSLQKPVCVMRESTERNEGLHAEMARLVGIDSSDILQGLIEVSELNTAFTTNPYGDGETASRICSRLFQD
ncbi:MAG: UDP-N-acetylglucosamine 2-epimerase (non-hydrolyzing) [bacterium]|nr:UDP-N-acetylglucosamine 2-epimerase (non-hydrolyzing) [bacterium]